MISEETKWVGNKTSIQTNQLYQESSRRDELKDVRMNEDETELMESDEEGGKGSSDHSRNR